MFYYRDSGRKLDSPLVGEATLSPAMLGALNAVRAKGVFLCMTHDRADRTVGSGIQTHSRRHVYRPTAEPVSAGR